MDSGAVGKMTTGDEKKRARFMSTAGPSLPVVNKKTDDIVPPGSAWLERLHEPQDLERMARQNQADKFPGGDMRDFLDSPGDENQKPVTGSFKAKSALSLVEELSAKSAQLMGEAFAAFDTDQKLAAAPQPAAHSHSHRPQPSHFGSSHFGFNA